ncbi:DciA family protein [Pelotalea chapellei]|uniref:DUF721 domain-containing protein n=1 Tax=Pelotalea chapellei TaxID=44671 RepID=A0ABS5UBQ0_9BACT|nr:DUF721 domain-containing protein [Pelotalea chapellei]MBT1073071.1 DUF721 domain-containing protein [Pelotalea chapellei]
MAKRAKMRFPAPLAEILQDGLKGLGISERLREAVIWNIWSDVVGPAVASRAQPLRIINGILTVAVSSGPWMQELTFLKGMMKQKLNDRLGGEVVRDIQLRSGQVPKPAVFVEEVPVPKKPLTVEQLVRIESESAAITDEETRTAFAELMKASLAVREKA